MSISTLYQDALQKYGKLVLDFEEHASPLAPTLQAHNVGIKDEYGRLRIWGEQTRAVLPEKARYSLDEQLRENEQTRNIVLRTLRRLTNRIETVNDQLNVLRIQSSQNPDQSAQFGDYEDASSSDESLSTQSSALEPPKSRLCKAIESVFDSIRSLYHISALLKRPRNANKYLRSRNMMMPSQATLRAEEDYAHILEKMRQWRHLTMRLQVGGDEERAVTLEDIISRERDEDHELADITFLCQRLTWANKLRRNQFRYWEESPDQEYEIISRPNPKRAGAKNLSATQTSFSSVANSALADTRTEAGRLRTEYTKSVVGRSNVIRVPDVPECSKTTPEFECPFCHLMLSSDRMKDRRAWKRHVFRDLRPYVCSFKSCLDPGRLYITRHDWIYHEQQIHRRKWICPEDCAATFDSKAAITEHIKNDHFDGLETRQVSIFADMCERQIDATELDECLICLEKMSLFRLQQHLATHMEEIALFVLPHQPQDDEVERNYDDLNEGSVLDSEGMPEYAETRHEKVPALVSGIRHSRSEEDLGSLGEVGEYGHNSAAVMVDNGKPSNIKDETIQDSYAHAVPDPLYAQTSPGDPFIPFAPALGSTEKRLPRSPEPVEMGDPYEQWGHDSWQGRGRGPPSPPPQARYDETAALKQQQRRDAAAAEARRRHDEEIAALKPQIELERRKEEASAAEAKRIREEEANALKLKLELEAEREAIKRKQAEEDVAADRHRIIDDYERKRVADAQAAKDAEVAFVPVYPRINRKFLDIETLEHYHVPWEWDRANSEYIILLRELDKYETDVLFEHTRRRRQGLSN